VLVGLFIVLAGRFIVSVGLFIVLVGLFIVLVGLFRVLVGLFIPQVALIVHPHRERVPIRHENPLPNVELVPPHQQRVLNVLLHYPPIYTI
jgi:hypothetical protein